jgi:hypothetical protein
MVLLVSEGTTMKTTLAAVSVIVLISACAPEHVTRTTQTDDAASALIVRSVNPPYCYGYQTSDPGYPGSYDGMYAVSCNAAALAIGIASKEWAQSADMVPNGPYNYAIGEDEMMLHASTNCIYNTTESWPYGWRVTLNDNTVFSADFTRQVCDPMQ